MPRKDFYGHDLNWYAIDSVGRVGLFTAGYAPIPTAVFLDEGLLERVDEYFQCGADRCSSSLSIGVAHVHRVGGAPDYSIALAEARKGVFVFGETGKPGAPTYELEACPAKPLLAEELPSDLGAAVSLVRFQTISFPDVDVFEPELFVPCDR